MTTFPPRHVSHIVEYFVEHCPPTVSAQTLLKDVIAQLAFSSHDYVLVMDNQIPSGILTAKDVLKLVSQHPDRNLAAIATLMTPLKAQVIDADLETPHTVLAPSKRCDRY
jgi:signal-transduction protein with cAMP-binding, CBS, and nucleotidyltransferase domain